MPSDHARSSAPIPKDMGFKSGVDNDKYIKMCGGMKGSKDPVKASKVKVKEHTRTLTDQSDASC